MLRRIASVAAIVAGGLLLWLTSETAGGAIVMLAGIALEILGIKLDHRARRQPGG